MNDKEFNKCTEERPCTPCFTDVGECTDPTSSWQVDKGAWPVSKEAAKDLAALFDPNAFEKGRVTFSHVTFWQFCRAMMRQCRMSQAPYSGDAATHDAEPIRVLTDEEIDAVVTFGSHHNAAGGIYASHVHEFARDIIAAIESQRSGDGS